jgi:hypothetical protein
MHSGQSQYQKERVPGGIPKFPIKGSGKTSRTSSTLFTPNNSHKPLPQRSHIRIQSLGDLDFSTDGFSSEELDNERKDVYSRREDHAKSIYFLPIDKF